MLDKKDIALLQGMFLALEGRLDEKWDIRFSDFKHEIRDEIHSVVKAEVFASEKRMMKRMDDVKGELVQKIEHVESVLQNEIDGTNTILLSFIEEVEPRIEKHEKKIVRLRRHMTLGEKVKVS